MRNTLVLLWCIFECSCVLGLATKHAGSKKSKSFPSTLRASFYSQRGCHNGTQEVESCTVVESISCYHKTNTFNAMPTCPSCFTGDGEEARPSCHRLAWPRRASEPTRHVVPRCWLAAELVRWQSPHEDLHATTQVLGELA